MEITLPPLYQINLKETGNSVIQLSAPSLTIQAHITPFSEGRTKGFVITPEIDAPAIAVMTNTGAASESFEYVLRLRIDTPDPSSTISLDLSQARWENHLARLSQPLNTITEFENHAIDVRDSWIGAFSYRGESAERQIMGLRPPQIGAIHAIQSHWSVSSEPATVVLPTGVGKTETMLSTLIVEQCHRLLVIVPTDVLRTQLAEKFISLGILKSPYFRSWQNTLNIRSSVY